MQTGAEIYRGAELAAVIGRLFSELVEGGETGCDAMRGRFSVLERPGRNQFVADVSSGFRRAPPRSAR